VSCVDQSVIDLGESKSMWGVPGLEVDSFVHEVRTFDRHLPACGKVDQSEAMSRLRMPAPAPVIHKIDPWPPLLSHLLVHVC
jgi:hypothetical protein